jgi:RNA-binding protein PNO1
LSRCIGRICGEKGKTKNAIENATRTRIIIQDQKISLLGSSTNIAVARNSICSLILGAPPGKVYASLRTIGKKINDKI